MAYEIEFAESALHELEDLKSFLQKKILGAIKKQLVDQPSTPAKNQKCLNNLSAGFESDPPLWELRVGEYRVFYDVNEEVKIVFIRAVRLKPPEKRTQDIVQ